MSWQRGVLGTGLSLALIGAPRVALAFERQWHVGASAGAATANGYAMSPAVGLYGAYGLSDVFDARLELTARGYGLRDESRPHGISGMVGVAYKLDVIRWVPWAAVYVGYQGFLKTPAEGAPFQRHDAAIAFGLGLDYALSRSFGLGATLRSDQTLRSAQGTSFDTLLRAEYRWGW